MILRASYRKTSSVDIRVNVICEDQGDYKTMNIFGEKEELTDSAEVLFTLCDSDTHICGSFCNTTAEAESLAATTVLRISRALKEWREVVIPEDKEWEI